MLLMLIFTALAQAKTFDFNPRHLDATDITKTAPVKPESVSWIAQPESGNDLGSIGGDWLQRQIHLSTNGADQRLIDSFNSFFSESQKPSQVGGRAPANDNNAPAVHMTRLGEFQSGATHIDLINSNLTTPLFQDVDLRLHHENTVNTLHVEFSW